MNSGRKIFPALFLSKTPYKEIYFRLGYPSEDRVAQEQKERILFLCQELAKIWRPKGILSLETVQEFQENGIRTENLFLPGSKLAQRFDKSRKISLLAVTAGEEAMEWLYQFKEKDKWHDFTLADAILSECTDELAQILNILAEREAHKQGYFLTPRLSPGYGDFPLNFQKNLLDFLRASEIGISLNESFLMSPEKSVTAAIGWIKK